MTEPTVIVLDDTALTPASLEAWRDYLKEQQDENITRFGEFPHRVSSTVHAMVLGSIDNIIDLAIVGVKARSRHGKQAKGMAADYLREIADKLDPSK